MIIVKFEIIKIFPNNEKLWFLQFIGLLLISSVIIGSAFVLFALGMVVFEDYILDDIPIFLRGDILLWYSLLIGLNLFFYSILIKYLLVDALSKSSFTSLNLFTLVCNLATPMSVAFLLMYSMGIDASSKLDMLNEDVPEFIIVFLFIYFPLAQYQVNKISYEYNLLELNKIAKLEERIDTLSVTKKDTFWTLLITVFNHFTKKK